MNRAFIGPADKTDALVPLIAADFDGGFTLIDPEGTIAETVVSLVPKQYQGRVVYFDPTDADFPMAFNPWARTPLERHDALAQELCAIVDVLLPEGPTMLTRAQTNFALTIHYGSYWRPRARRRCIS
jgi:hypothetical protein